MPLLGPPPAPRWWRTDRFIAGFRSIAEIVTPVPVSDYYVVVGEPGKFPRFAPTHTVVLPRFGVEALAGLVSQSGMDGPVFATRDGGWVSLANLRRCLREALPQELLWVTPHSFRKTVGTVVRDAHGPAVAQQQLSHTELATTERHYLQRQTRGPDVRSALDKFAGQESG